MSARPLYERLRTLAAHWEDLRRVASAKFPSPPTQVAPFIEAVQEAADTIESLERERDDWRARAEALANPEQILANLDVRDAKGEVEIRGGVAVELLARGLYRFLGPKEEAPNYRAVTIEISGPSVENDSFVVTVRRANGKAPEQLVSDLRTRAEMAEAKVTRVEALAKEHREAERLHSTLFPSLVRIEDLEAALAEPARVGGEL